MSDAANASEQPPLARRGRGLRRLFRRHALFRVRREEPRPDVAARIPLTFQRVTRENLSDVLSFRPPKVVAAFERRLDGGEVGIIAYYESKAVGHAWLLVNRETNTLNANGYFRLHPRAALVHFCSVDERHRGQGIFQAMLCELYRDAFATEPVDVIYIDTELVNAAAQGAIRKTATFISNEYYVTLLSHSFRLPWPRTVH